MTNRTELSKLIAIFFFCLSFFSIAQIHQKIDSLENLLKKSNKDTAKINILLSLVSITSDYDNVKAIVYAQQAVKLSEKTNFKSSKSYCDLAWLYKNTADYKKGLETYIKAEKSAANLKSPDKESALAEVYIGMSSIYSNLNNDNLAISTIRKAIDNYAKIKDTSGVAICNLNLGNYYNRKNEHHEALKYYKLSETLFIQIKDTFLLRHCYNSIGSSLFQLKNFKDALTYFNKFYELTYKLTPDDNSSLAIALQNIGETNAYLGNFKIAIDNSLSAIDLLKKIKDYNNMSIVYENVAGYYEYLGDYKSSNHYYSAYIHLKDSLFDEDTKATLHEMSVKYETEKKEKENEVLSLENKNKKQIIYIVAGACAFLSCLVFFIYFIYRNKKKSHKLLEEKNTIINFQKEIVEEQNQEIKDSIKYAHRIQGAILPPRNLWKQILPNSFVLHLPKDILSGDFYWIEENKDYVYVAAADCTGHGVPGALISIVCYNLLNKAVLEKNLVSPSEILDAVNLWLTESLHQTYRESTVKDGMDVSLIAIHKHSNEILFAGANNPIYIVSNEELKQIKGDKFPVGAFIEDKIQNFSTKSFKAYPGDMIYLFSDGFADQFGGENGKKYKYAHFQQKLIAISGRELDDQRKTMKDEFYFWKGPHEQVDDVLLIGIKIK